MSLSGALADEGMWLFNQPPKLYLRKNYQFEADSAWLEHLQKSSVRFNSGGSGSFVSEDGLLISNHHVGSDALQKLSSEKNNYLRDGFYARRLEDEVRCLDLELNVLQSIEDVTERVNAGVASGLDAQKAFAARRQVIAGIEKESIELTGLRSDVVTLWQGGAYHLYRYKRYTDVRLVFAPEQKVAFYGGDPDNFEFPRFDLDIALFRAYENGKPAHITNFLRVSSAGAAEGELVFVSGHPGRTSRLLTVAELELMRQVQLPYQLNTVKRNEVLLGNWSERNPENARRARGVFFGTQNRRKKLDGQLAGMLDPSLMEKKFKEEEGFKAVLRGNPDFAGALKAYDSIAAAAARLAPLVFRHALLEGEAGFRSDSFSIARTLLRAGVERPKPNGERLKEFSDSGRVSLELSLFSKKPFYEDLEVLRLTDGLTALANELGATNGLVLRVLEGKSPRERAAALIQTTRVRDAAFRRQLYDGGAQAVMEARDPMIELARLVDGESRAIRKVFEAEGEVREQGHAAISRARNALLGTAGYPDATFTLRLAFGTVRGYREQGASIPAFTTFGGLFQKSREMNNQPPYDLPPAWIKRRGSLRSETPFNFVSTADIIGGNSGSPVVNRAGEFVGIIFDGNLQSLTWDEAFDDREGRATSVSSPAILEALGKVYRAQPLVKELREGRRLELSLK
jgi:hypothetical protein